MAYPTLSDLKAQLGITGNDQDTRLAGALAGARGAVENYCGYVWERTDAETRTFERRGGGAQGSWFDISNPGLLSIQAGEVWRYVRPDDVLMLLDSDYVLRRFSVGGDGPYDRITVGGVYEFCRITGVWGAGLVAPAEVGEVVKMVATAIYEAGSGQLIAGDDSAGDAVFDDGLVQFMLNGHRRYR